MKKTKRVKRGVKISSRSGKEVAEESNVYSKEEGVSSNKSSLAETGGGAFKKRSKEAGGKAGDHRDSVLWGSGGRVS